MLVANVGEEEFGRVAAKACEKHEKIKIKKTENEILNFLFILLYTPCCMNLLASNIIIVGIYNKFILI